MASIVGPQPFQVNLIAAASDQVAERISDRCEESRCGGDGPPIKFPFRLKNGTVKASHDDCGYPGFELFCVGNETALELPIPTKYLFVSKIDYLTQEIYLYNTDECGLVQQDWRLFTNFSISPFEFVHDVGSTLFECPMRRSLLRFYSDQECPSSDPGRYVTVLPSYYGIELSLSDLVSCSKMYDVPSVSSSLLMPGGRSNPSSSPLVKWSRPDCRRCEAKGKRCRLRKLSGADQRSDETECFDLSKPRRKGVIVGSLIVILAAMAIFHVYTTDKNEREAQKRITKFLEDYKAFKPSRYTYADIKKITNQFKDKLGQGAYGTVFKGKLSNDIHVAVKVLNNSTGNGEEFINEVATMGRIHHVNVVRMVGFCADGFERALVYEFLPNDSLEKYTTSATGGGNRDLSWEMLEGIALGIAKGIEYLHQGCDQRILHFDIKPHNVLLDHNFTPKISDFGMAKLCSKDQSVVSMTTARGTMGYIAPEVFSRNFGNVSYKSDVYSFGMLLLEMVGGRKKTNVVEENTEQIYYPEWIYNLLEEGDDLRISIEEEGDAKIGKKLAIVGLWCIQWHPISRPTMKVVVQMLEGEEELTMPPNPFASSGSSKTDSKIPARRMALGLEAISE
ncbi:hypothetical protein TIFTF001_020853 [Ficus carica]|uniref:Protein kinase domain-containing protein n=1 Tax=Ficus carica TaxID=3494 RepID=A0AA88AS16_FICCA|nr:hypothetical protein TIFTF001_020853 [Ficus carica]